MPYSIGDSQVAAGKQRGLRLPPAQAKGAFRMAQRFYVAQVNPGAERVALAELLRVKIQAILLTRIYETAADQVRPWRGQAQRSAPLFPGYLFLQMDVSEVGQRWRLACSRRGVHCLLGPTPERPLPVPVGIVEELVQRWVAGEYDERNKQAVTPRVQVEQFGRVTDGNHFANRVGQCVYSSAKRVDLLIGLMKVSFAPSQVALAG